MFIHHPDLTQLRAAVLSIGAGRGGIMDTVRVMRALVDQYKTDPNIRATAITITQLDPEKQPLPEIHSIFSFVRDHVRYINDVNGVETVTSPDKTLALRAGDCDDKSVLLATLLESIGYITRFIVTGYSEPGVYEHVYVSVMLPDGSFLPLDSTEPHAPGWEQAAPVAYWAEGE